MNLFIRKVLAYGIDYLIFIGVTGLYLFCSEVFFLSENTYKEGIIMLLCCLVTVLLLTSYIPTTLKGQTIGMKITKVKVVNKNNKPRTYVQSFLRECVLKMTFAPLFFCFNLFYFIFICLIVKRDINEELPHDFIMKTQIELIS